MSRPSLRLRVRFLSMELVVGMVFASLGAAGAPPCPPGEIGADFAHYISVLDGLWIRPLALVGRELSLRTDFYMPEGLHTVLIDVLGDVDCDTGKQPRILETQLMLSGGTRVVSYVYREPAGVHVDAQTIEKRIATVLAFVRDEWSATPSGPSSLTRGPGETWRRIPLDGPRLKGSAVFDTATGRLVGLDLLPSE